MAIGTWAGLALLVQTKCSGAFPSSSTMFTFAPWSIRFWLYSKKQQQHGHVCVFVSLCVCVCVCISVSYLNNPRVCSSVKGCSIPGIQEVGINVIWEEKLQDELLLQSWLHAMKTLILAFTPQQPIPQFLSVNLAKLSCERVSLHLITCIITNHLIVQWWWLRSLLGYDFLVKMLFTRGL